MTKLEIKNYKLNRELYTIIDNLESPVYSYVKNKNGLDNLTNFYRKQTSKKKYYDLSKNNKLLNLFNKFI